MPAPLIALERALLSGELLRRFASARWTGLARAGRARGATTGMHGPVALVEVLRAVRADVPLGADQLSAGRALALETRAARRAEDVVLVDALAAGRAHKPLLRFGEQALLRELTLIRLAERLAR